MSNKVQSLMDALAVAGSFVVRLSYPFLSLQPVEAVMSLRILGHTQMWLKMHY